MADVGADLPENPEEVRPLGTFPKTIIDTLRALSLTGKLKGVAVLGSGARRVVAFPSDTDAFARFEAPYADKKKAAEWGAERFQRCIENALALPSTFLGDVKAGILQDCRVLPWHAFLKGGTELVGYDMKQAIARVEEMHAKKLLTDAEAKHSIDMLHEAGEKPDAEAWFMLLDSLRFEVVRWSLDEIRKGSKKVRGNRTLTLAEAFQQSALIKADLVIFNPAVGRFQDLSQIYELSTSKGEIVNDVAQTQLPLQESIGMDVVRYGFIKHKYLKVSKRMLSLATLHDKDAEEEALLAISNSNAGLLYGVQADATCAEWVVENAHHFAEEKLLVEVDAMRARIASAAVLLEQYPELEAATQKEITAVLRAKSHKQMAKPLRAVADTLAGPINESALQQLKDAKLWPPPKWALP